MNDGRWSTNWDSCCRDSGKRAASKLHCEAAALVVDELRKENVEVEVINPAELDLQFPGLDRNGDSPKVLRKAVANATGVIFATPEYHGSFSSVTKLVIENLGFPSVLAGKPVALLGVAAGRIGAIKSLEQLRGVCSHVGALVLPSLVSVADVQRVFDAEGRCLVREWRRRSAALPRTCWATFTATSARALRWREWCGSSSFRIGIPTGE